MLKREKITESINSYFVDKINSKTWKVGSLIPSETTLTNELGVSRASLRVSIQQFVALGLMQSFQGKGTFLISDDTDVFENSALVSRRCYSDIKNVLSFRRLVEPEATYLAVLAYKNGNKALLANLQKTLLQMEQSLGNADAFIEADLKFHSFIAKGSNNEVIADALVHTFTKTIRHHKQMNTLFGFNNGIKYHKMIIQAFINGDAIAARDLMDNHLSHAISEIDKLNT